MYVRKNRDQEKSDIRTLFDFRARSNALANNQVDRAFEGNASNAVEFSPQAR